MTLLAFGLALLLAWPAYHLLLMACSWRGTRAPGRRGRRRGGAEPHRLTEVRRFMVDPGVGAVQCRVRIHNRDRLLGAVQDLEFGCIANASQVLRDRFGTVGLGGNGQFARLSVLATLGDEPWSH